MGAPVLVDKALGERGSQPADQRTAPGIGIERAAPFALADGQPVELRVETVGEFAAQAFVAGDGHAGAEKRLPVKGNESLPGALVPTGAGARQHQIR